MGVAAAFGILIGILTMAILLLRIIAVAKTRFWEDKAKVFGRLRWKPSGFTVQFTLSVLPHDGRDAAAPRSPVAILSSVDDQGKLIDT